ncbi:MAG: molybdopterin-dependent oxidoreductase [Spirochaetaceae bacterium]|nr:molybdopterin-dependent oxidoreductase [Spirochaetaceae bacterium]
MITKKKQLFLNDYYLPNMLNALVFRSEKEKGVIKSAKLPPLNDKNYTIISINDIPGNKEISFLNNQVPILTDKKVNYKGEPVYIITYKNEESRKFAVNGIFLDIEQDPYLSFLKDKIIEEQIVYKKSYSFSDDQDSKIDFSQLSENISLNENKYLESDNDLLLQIDNFFANPYHTRYCEPYGAIAQPEKNGNINIYTVTQCPSHVQKSVADTLGISPKNVKVIITALSSPLEGRIWYPSLISCQAAVAAWKTGKPVKLILSKQDTDNYTPAQFPFRITYKTAISKIGKLKKMEINLEIDAGAYPIIIDELYEKSFFSATGFLDCPDISMNLSVIKTSKPPMSFISSFNFSMLNISLEKHISNMVRKLRLSPVEWRRNNTLEKLLKNRYWSVQKEPKQPITYNKESILSIIDAISVASDFERKYASFELMRTNKKNNKSYKLSGIGFSLAFFSNAIPLKSMEKDKLSLKMVLDNSSNLNIYTLTVPNGNHNYDIWKKYTGELLEIPMEKIYILPHRTDIATTSAPYVFSKGLAGFSELLRKASHNMQKKRAKNSLPIEITTSLSLETLNKNDLSWGAAVVELSIDTFTYEIEIKGVWYCFDCGYMLNKDIMDKSVYSGIIDSLNWISGASEKAWSLQSKNIRHFMNIPIFTEYTNVTKKNKSFDIGDLPLSLTPGAYYNALIQALGEDIYNIPMTIDKVDTILNISRQK